jgi:hypothetical protein
MSEPSMSCARAEELLSDHLEGTLPEPLRRELEEHLGACGECAPLRAALGDVVEALRAYPALEPPADLAQRAASAALARARERARPRLAWRFSLVPPAFQAAAAVLALAVTGAVVLATADGGATRVATRVKQRTHNAGAYLVERRDRLVEDFRLLRVFVGAAFDSRVESVGERVEDYRRLLQQRRQREQEPRKTNSTGPEEAEVQAATEFPELQPMRPRTS